MMRGDYSIQLACPIFKSSAKVPSWNGRESTTGRRFGIVRSNLDIEDQMHLSLVVNKGYFRELHRTGGGRWRTPGPALSGPWAQLTDSGQ
jgi:hypothetical protein